MKKFFGLYKIRIGQFFAAVVSRQIFIA